MKDFYYILGADRKATPVELNAAYRKLARKFDPAGGDDDPFLESHFHEITEAYQLLSDPSRRRKYDAAFKKSQQRRFYWWFRIGHINMAAALTLCGFTLLFGWYVLRMISGTSTTPAKKTMTAVVTPPKIKHHKKKHAVPPKVNALIPVVPMALNQPIPKPVKAVDTVHPRVTPPAPAKPTPVSIKQAAPVNAIPAVPAAAGYTAAIRSNETGVVYLHQLAAYQSAVVASIPNHAQVRVLEKSGGFYKISFNEQTGYVPKWTVREP